jgi:hypothetical protein
MTKPIKSATSLLLGAVTGLNSVSRTAPYEVQQFAIKRGTVTAFNIRTEQTIETICCYQNVVDSIIELAEAMPYPSYAITNSSRDEIEVSTVLVIAAFLAHSLLREQTPAQIAARLPEYTPDSTHMVAGMVNILAEMVRADLVIIRRAQGKIPARYILRDVTRLQAEARDLATYSGIIKDLDARIVGNMLVLSTGESIPILAGSTLSPVIRLPEATDDHREALEAWRLAKDGRLYEIEHDPLRGTESIEYALISQERPPHALITIIENSGACCRVLMNQDARGRETVNASVAFHMPKAWRGQVKWADDARDLIKYDGSALCLALSAFIFGSLLPQHAAEMNLTSVWADPYAAIMNLWGQRLRDEIMASPTDEELTQLGNWTRTKYLREVAKKITTPIAYGSGIATSAASATENCLLSEELGTRAATIARLYAPLKNYLSTVQAGKNLNSSYSYQFTFHYDGEVYTVQTSLNNEYYGDVYMLDNVPIVYTADANNGKARIASPANINQHLESTVLRALRMIAERVGGDAPEWRIFATHDSLGTTDADSIEYLIHAIPAVLNAWATQARDGFMEHFQIAVPPHRITLPDDWKGYVLED